MLQIMYYHWVQQFVVPPIVNNLKRPLHFIDFNKFTTPNDSHPVHA